MNDGMRRHIADRLLEVLEEAASNGIDVYISNNCCRCSKSSLRVGFWGEPELDSDITVLEEK